MIVKPFRGYRPRPDLAERIPSPPYDVLDVDEARRLAAGNPDSFLHVIRAEIDLAPDVSPYDDRVYQTARDNLRKMIDEGRLVRDERPTYYVYRLKMGEHEQTGILGAASVDDYLEGRIKKHEHTRPEKEQDRARLIDALSFHPGPLFLTYRPLPELNAVVGAVCRTDPAVRFRAPDGVEHTLWCADDRAHCVKIEELFGKVRCTYVADGHHRAAASARVCAERRARLEQATGEEACNYVLAAHFPSDQLRVLDYNRVVADLNGLAPDEFVQRVRDAGFDVKPGHRERRPPHRQSFGMYVAGTWYLLTAGPEMARGGDVVERLDVAILSRHLLEPVLGIGDARRDRRIDFVGGIRGPGELQDRVDSGRAAVAFALWPTSLDEVMQVADAGAVMPPKSTWFEPKLRSGMAIQSLEGDRP